MRTTPSETGLRSMLTEQGLRVTRPRLAVLSILVKHPHATVDEIATGVRAELTTVSTQAVYDILGALSERGILRRMEPAASAARYELTPPDDHQHLVCRGCGEIIDILLTGLPPLEVTHGYRIDSAEVTYWGTCPACQRQESAPKEQT